MKFHSVPFSDLVGKTLTNIVINDDKTEILFLTSDGLTYGMYHHQDCCESVYLDDVVGMPITQLIGSPILLADVRNSQENAKVPSHEESFTWTFYELANINGAVTLRWYGTSNGYYSESVDFECLTP